MGAAVSARGETYFQVAIKSIISQGDRPQRRGTGSRRCSRPLEHRGEMLAPCRRSRYHRGRPACAH